MEIRIFSILIFCGLCCNSQIRCPVLLSPLNGDTDVAVDTEISWSAIPGIDGYSVSIGTFAGSTNILNSRSAALVNSVTPLVGLPENTEIFVTISLYLKDGSFLTCLSESFITEEVTIPPDCTTLNIPMDGAQNVQLGEDISWNYAPRAIGYRLIVGTTNDGSEILEDIDVGNVLTYNLDNNLPKNTEIFVSILPYNENGGANSCQTQSFTTGDSSVDCDLFNPLINLSESFGICSGQEEIRIEPDTVADGYRWYQVNDDGTEVLISESMSITIINVGKYRYEAYIEVSLFGEDSECSSSILFSVYDSDIATVDAVNIIRDGSGIDLEIQVNGPGDYEYSINDIEGPYQESPIFSSVSEEDYLIYIRDKNGCGTVEYVFIQTISKEDFPRYFTPNNDGINDYWRPIPLNQNIASLDTTYIFDRYGNLLSQFSPESKGWDGTFNGRHMPSSTYWYKAVSKSGREVKGYFMLKR